MSVKFLPLLLQVTQALGLRDAEVVPALRDELREEHPVLLDNSTAVLHAVVKRWAALGYVPGVCRTPSGQLYLALFGARSDPNFDADLRLAFLAGLPVPERCADTAVALGVFWRSVRVIPGSELENLLKHNGIVAARSIP